MEQKARIERAASLDGTTVAAFAVSSLLDAAAATITSESQIVLSESAWAEFAAALEAADSEAWQRLRATKPVWEK